MRRILFVASEAFPLIKTGGLGDVAGSLPAALRANGEDAITLMPAYPRAKAEAQFLTPIAHLCSLRHHAQVLAGTMPDTGAPVWLLDCPPLYQRPGASPYADEDNRPWPDNAERFGFLGWAAATLARGTGVDGWAADILHANDWQTGLAPAYLSAEHSDVATVFTIHNLSYQGLFPKESFRQTGLPAALWGPNGVEFYGQFSFIKTGLIFADRINAVSPTYAREIQTPAFGCGLEGLLRHREERLSGILNGIDDSQWNPWTDPYLEATYDTTTLDRKILNKTALQRRLKLAQRPESPCIGVISRLVEQKGIDLLLDALPHLIHMDLQLAVLGSGEARFEQWLSDWARDHSDRIAVYIGYDESLSHQIEAGADFFLMPSRFEPCGLNQMYSQRYGTPPIVHRVGGLADTVVDASHQALKDRTATGLVFHEASSGALIEAVKRALMIYADPPRYQQMQEVGMAQDFSWNRSARAYQQLYDQAQADRLNSRHD